nr:phage portal protein [Micromonospora sp. DSM 115978]
MTSYEQQRGLWVPEGSARSSTLSMQDFADLFTFGGTAYPFLTTTMGALDEEAIAKTLTGIYRNNGPVFALVLARMQIFAQARLQWTRFNGGAPGDLFYTPDLDILERPWPGAQTPHLLARMEQDDSTAGNAYIRRLRRTGPPDRLVRLRPQWMYIVLGSESDADHPDEADDVELAGYYYRPPNGRASIFLPEEIAHYAPIPDPDAHFLGMSWISAVLRDAMGDSLMTDHKRAFLKNAATPNMVIRFDPSVTLQAVKDFKEVFEAQHAGAFNAYKTLFLGGGADATVVGRDFQQLDFAVVQGKAESRLAAASGVPPSWVGFSEGLQGSALNAGNFSSARRRLSDGTMQHLWTAAAASLETLVNRPNGATLWFSTKGMPFMRIDAGEAAKVQHQEAQTITALVRDGYEPDSVTAAVIANDWSLLRHTGRLSVQLQTPTDDPDDPGGADDETGDGDDADVG